MKKRDINSYKGCTQMIILPQKDPVFEDVSAGNIWDLFSKNEQNNIKQAVVALEVVCDSDKRIIRDAINNLLYGQQMDLGTTVTKLTTIGDKFTQDMLRLNMQKFEAYPKLLGSRIASLFSADA